MKLYRKLLPIFLFCSTFYLSIHFNSRVVAQLPVATEKTDSVSETEIVESPKNELSQIFPDCPLVDENVPTLIVETRVIETEATSKEENLQNSDRQYNTSPENREDKQSNLDLEESNSKDDSASDKDSETETAAAEEEEIINRCPTVEEINRYQQFAKADRLYLAGDKAAATKIYKTLKEPWDEENILNNLERPIYETTELSPGGRVYWRTYQQGKEQKLESKIFTPLELLVTKDSNFIPGHIAYSAELMAVEKEEEAHAVMERAIGLYPNEAPLLKAKIDTDVKSERWLEASIAARQFALFNPDSQDAAEFTTLADRYLQKYQAKIKEELTWNAVGNAITGAAGFALTGNLFGPISAIETTMIMLQGEAKLGDRFARRAQKQLPLVEDEEVVNYVNKIGHKIADVAGRDEFEYEFFVIQDKNLNAFALPGGKIFVNTGAIMNTDSEAELAGLLAHEVSHSVLSHGFQLVTRGSLTSNVAQYIPYVGSTASNLIVMNYSRDMERQADIFGTRILVAADYAADGVRNLMAKLGEIHAGDEDHQEPPAWLSTHPNTKTRVSYIEELVMENNLNRYAYEGMMEHQKVKQKTKQLWQEYQAEKAAEEDD